MRLVHVVQMIVAMSLMHSSPSVFAQEFTGDRDSFGKRWEGSYESIQSTERSFNNQLTEKNFEPVINFGPESLFRQFEMTVGFLDVLTSSNSPKCTGILIAADHVLTNAHCIPATTEAVEFTLGYLTTEKEQPGQKTYKASPTPVERDDDLDYAILKLQRPVEGYSKPQFTVRNPKPTEGLIVIGYPLAQPLHMLRVDCQAHRERPVDGHRLTHVCPTFKGNSGSLIISAEDLRVVVGIHHAEGVGGSHGIRFASIMEVSPLVREFLKGPDQEVISPLYDPPFLPPASVFQDSPDLPEMVVISAGEFMMGAGPDDPHAQRDERPQRLVTIAKPFAMGRFEVTIGQWNTCVEAGFCKLLKTRKNSTSSMPITVGRGKVEPIIRNYIDWINSVVEPENIGGPYRLPTAEEWEFAARGGTETPYHTGSTVTPMQEHFRSDRKMPVGSFKSNPLGLFDMLGNVHEIVTVGDKLKGRGGAYYDDREALRVTNKNRGFYHQGSRTGIRLVRDMN